MLHLQTFGGLAILRDGRAHERVSTHRKRLVLLAVLAAAGPRGVSRDKLLAMFWPESDTDRARANLKQAVFTLRRELGAPEVIVGAGELRLNEAVMQSDLAAFACAIEAGNLREAVTLYTGEFLDGIRIGDEPEIERWIESYRARLARDFQLALRELTAIVSSSAELALVRRRWERLVAEDPANRDAASQLIAVLLRLRDVDGAKRVARAYDGFVHSEWGHTDEGLLAKHVEEEVTQLGRLSPVSITSQQPVSITSQLVAPALDGRPAGPPLRLRIAAASAAIVTILAATAIAVAPRWTRAPASTLDVAIIDADSAHGDPDLLERSIVAMTRATLARGASINVVDARATSLARHLINESVVHTGRDVHVIAELRVRLRGSWSAPSRVEVDGTEAQAAFIGAQLGTRILGQLLGASSIGLTDAAAQSTRSVSALQEFASGEAEYRAGRFARAADAFQRAVGDDSAFAVAWYRLSVTCDWAGRVDCSYDAARRAAARADRLDEHTHLLLDGLRAWHGSNREEAERIYAYITAHYPDDAEAWYQLGDSRFHLGPFAGLPIEAAREPFERAARLDSTGPEALIHLARIAALRGDVRAADTLYTGAIARSDPTARKELVVMRAFSIHDTAAIHNFLGRQTRGESDQFLWLVAERLASYAGDLSASESVFRSLAGEQRVPSTRSAAHTELGVIALEHGELALADSEFAIAGTFDAPLHAARYALERRRLLRMLPDLPGYALHSLPPSATAEATRPTTASAEYAAPDLRDMAEARYGESPAMVDAFLGAIEDGTADSAIARRPMAVLRTMDSGRGDSARALLSAVRAARAFRKGRWDIVERNLDVRLATPLWLPLMPIERYWHAVALMKTHRTSEAIQWFGSFALAPEQRTMEARAHLERARLLRTIGDTAAARADYRKVIELWSRADPILKPMVDEARRALR
jgi:DNA-binding SARP family transcriptional activator/Flp pilus assembly protein TadD